MRCHAHQVTRQHAYPNSLAGAVLNQSESVKWRNECGVMLIKWRDKQRSLPELTSWSRSESERVCEVAE